MNTEDTPSVQIYTKNLDVLIGVFRNQLTAVRVGILGDKTNRPGAKGGPTNAEIGAKYEFSNGSTAGGSFLRVPISDHLDKELQSAGAMSEEVWKQIIKDKSVAVLMKKIGILCEGIVAGAFDSGGYGKWKPSDMRHKKNKQTLVETTQLRNSITSDIKG